MDARCAFVTDFLWRSPLGLRINAQATADVLMTEDWVKIRGDQLAPRDGAYDLRITAELWETHFFDLVSLLGRRSSRPAPRCSSTSASRCRRPQLQVVADRAGAGVRSVRDDTGGDVSTLAARDDSLSSISPAAARTRGSRARTSSKSSCRTRRREPARCGSSRRAGSIRPTARSTSRSRQGEHAAPKACRCTSPTRRAFHDRCARGSGFPPARTRRC